MSDKPGAQVYIDALDIIAEDHGSGVAMKIVRALLRLIKSSKGESFVLSAYFDRSLVILLPVLMSPLRRKPSIKLPESTSLVAPFIASIADPSSIPPHAAAPTHVLAPAYSTPPHPIPRNHPSVPTPPPAHLPPVALVSSRRRGVRSVLGHHRPSASAPTRRETSIRRTRRCGSSW